MERGKEGESVPEIVDEESGYTEDVVPDWYVKLDPRSRWRASRSEVKWGTVCISPRVVRKVLVCADDEDERIDRGNASRRTLDPRLRCGG